MCLHKPAPQDFLTWFKAFVSAEDYYLCITTEGYVHLPKIKLLIKTLPNIKVLLNTCSGDALYQFFKGFNEVFGSDLL